MQQHSLFIEPDPLADIVNEKKTVELGELIDVTPEGFRDMIAAIIHKAVEDFVCLNPFGQKQTNEMSTTEDVEYKTAESFLFDEVPAFGNLGWTFEDACDFLEFDAKSIRTKCFQTATNDPAMPTRHQMELF